MKIGLICPYDISRSGGVYEQVRAIREELEKRGHTAKIITPEPQDDHNSDPQHIIFIGSAVDLRSPFHTTVQVSASLNETIDRVLDAEQFDVLHFHEPWVPMLGRQILSRSNAVNIATFHAALPDTPMSRTFVKAVTPYTKSTLKYINEYTAVSEAAAEYICSLTDSPVTIIPNGIDLTRFKAPIRRDGTKEKKTIFYVGRLENRKGVKYLIRAFRLLLARKPNVSLVISGDGPDKDKLEALVENLGLQHDVTFTGFISDEQKIEYLQKADLFCSPALYGESFGIVLLEAMASGLVTVAGNNPGYSAIMHGLGSISIVDPKDSDDFAQRLDLLLHENELRKIWRSWAKEQLIQYGFPQVVSQYEEVYEAALAKRGHQHRSLRGALKKAK